MLVFLLCAQCYAKLLCPLATSLVFLLPAAAYWPHPSSSSYRRRRCHCQCDSALRASFSKSNGASYQAKPLHLLGLQNSPRTRPRLPEGGLGDNNMPNLNSENLLVPFSVDSSLDTPLPTPSTVFVETSMHPIPLSVHSLWLPNSLSRTTTQAFLPMCLANTDLG